MADRKDGCLSGCGGLISMVVVIVVMGATVIAVLTVISGPGGGPASPPQTKTPQTKSEDEIDSDGLVLRTKTVEGKITATGAMEITGTVVNNREKTLGYAQITFNVYDESGAQVGSALANINGLEPGGRWNFKAVTFAKGTTYKFSKLTGF